MSRTRLTAGVLAAVLLYFGLAQLASAQSSPPHSGLLPVDRSFISDPGAKPGPATVPHTTSGYPDGTIRYGIAPAARESTLPGFAIPPTVPGDNGTVIAASSDGTEPVYRTAEANNSANIDVYDQPPIYNGWDAPVLPAPDASLYQPTKLSEYKKGFFQKLAFTGSWIPKSSDDTLGWTRWDIRLSVAAPAPTIEWPLLITPGFTVYLTDGPGVPDVPAELYEASLGLTWVPKISERLRLILSATPGVYSDFQQTKGTSQRITGLALAAWDWVPNRTKLIVGVVYLDRDDFNILPAAGLVWTPNDNVKLDLVMPRPRANYRWRCGPGFEDWVYLAGEIGGGTWQIELADGTTDRITIRDFRLVLGAERKRDGGAGFFFDVGYVFGREIEYRWNPEEYSLDDGLMLRAGIAF